MICIPITSPARKEALHAIKRSCRSADLIELRMDLIATGNLAELIRVARCHSGSVKIIVTCRKKEEASRTPATARNKDVVMRTKDKIALLQEAIELGADFIDIELAEGGRAINALRALCKKKGGKTGVIISYHNFGETPALKELKKIFHRCAGFKPAIVKIVTTANHLEDNLITLNLISYARQRSQKIISFCMGDKGLISRVTAPLMGSVLSFAALEKKAASAPGQLTVSEMKKIRDVLQRTRKPKAASPGAPRPEHYILLGNPVGHSLSPFMHNAALRAMGLEASYRAYCVGDIGQAVDGIRGMNIRGASVTVPFKVAVMEYLDDLDDDALAIGAVNTIVNHKGLLKGYNTDWRGILLALKKKMMVKNKTVAIIGAGGTARAAAYGIIKEGGVPVIINRTIRNGEMIAGRFDCSFYPLSRAGEVKADCLINTTSVGMYPHNDQSPVKPSALKGYQYVMDVIYNPLKTRLLKDAGKQGCEIISGLDMFVHQGAWQLKLWTGKEPPRELMKKAVREKLTESAQR